MRLIIANACGLVACILMVWVGYERNKPKLLIIQIMQALLFATGNGLLWYLTANAPTFSWGYSGFSYRKYAVSCSYRIILPSH